MIKIHEKIEKWFKISIRTYPKQVKCAAFIGGISSSLPLPSNTWKRQVVFWSLAWLLAFLFILCPLREEKEPSQYCNWRSGEWANSCCSLALRLWASHPSDPSASDSTFSLNSLWPCCAYWLDHWRENFPSPQDYPVCRDSSLKIHRQKVWGWWNAAVGIMNTERSWRIWNNWAERCEVCRVIATQSSVQIVMNTAQGTAASAVRRTLACCRTDAHRAAR